jgi:hypothetical protein
MVHYWTSLNRASVVIFSLKRKQSRTEKRRSVNMTHLGPGIRCCLTLSNFSLSQQFLGSFDGHRTPRVSSNREMVAIRLSRRVLSFRTEQRESEFAGSKILARSSSVSISASINRTRRRKSEMNVWILS